MKFSQIHMRKIEKMMNSNILKIVKKFGVLAGTILGLNICYLLFLTVTYMIPTGAIHENVEESLTVWQYENSEEDMIKPLFGNKGFYLDTHSDLLWAAMCCERTGNPLESAIQLRHAIADENMNSYDGLIAELYYHDVSVLKSYARYWNLIVGVLKILFSVMTISDIRYLFYLVTTAMCVFVCYRLKKLAGIRGWAPAVMAFALISITLHATCLSFISDIFLTLFFMIGITYWYRKEWFYHKQENLFLILGSLTYACGPLVSPLMPLGMSLLLCLQLVDDSDKEQKESWSRIVKNTICWLIGYFSTVFIKQFLATLLKHDGDAMEGMIDYMGFDLNVFERLEIIENNFVRLLSPMPVKIPCLAAAVIILIVLMRKYPMKDSRTLRFIFIACYPLGWMLIMCRHAIHSFSSNVLMVLVYAGILAMMNRIDFSKIQFGGNSCFNYRRKY